MPRRVLDTNILISHWARGGVRRRRGQATEAVAKQWGRDLSRTFDSDAIVTPVEVEYLCGQRTGDELRLARAYLSAFDVIDGGQVLPEDWSAAKRIASRVPRDGRPRQLGDCLIRAICDRLHVDVLTAERRFPRDA
jgi:predicted nucleic acid-binding protein